LLLYYDENGIINSRANNLDGQFTYLATVG